MAATVLNSDLTAGELVTSSERGQSVTVTIPEGLRQSASTVAGGGVAFAPVVNGTTEVTADIAGFIQPPVGTWEVTVVSPGMQFNLPAAVGGGLYALGRGFLDALNHGGLNVTITTSSPSILQIGEADGSNPAASVTVFVADGQSQFEYTLHGVAGAVGTNVQVTASAPGFIDGTSFTDVVQPQFNLNVLNPTQTAGSAAEMAATCAICSRVVTRVAFF